MVEANNNGSRKNRLNFTHIYKVNFSDENNETIQQLTDEFNSLPDFRNGDRNNKGKGFLEFNDDFNFEFIINPPYEIEDQNHNMRYERPISIQNGSVLCKIFRYEEYFEGRNEAQYREADIFWIKPFNILLIKGSEQACKKIYNYLVGFNSAGFAKIEFNDYFLLWMSYKYEKFDGELSPNLIFSRMDKSRTQGSNTNENDIRVREGRGWMIPIPTLYGLLNEQRLSHIGGDFTYKDDILINAKLADDVSIFIYSSNDLSGKIYSEKCEYAFPFIIEIVDIFEKWGQRTSDDNKYPDDEFFDSAIESFRTQIEYSMESIGELKEKYRNLRNGAGD